MKIALALFSALCATSVGAFTAAPAAARTASTTLFAEDEAEASASMGGKAISALTSDVKTVFTSEEIDEFLPHRYPFALVDKVVEYEPGTRAVGIKSVTKVGFSFASFCLHLRFRF